MQVQYFRNANKKDAIFQDIGFGLPLQLLYVELFLYSHSYIRAVGGKSGIIKYLQMFFFSFTSMFFQICTLYLYAMA